MAKLIIEVETLPTEDGGPDPTLIDPHTIAEQLVDDYNEGCSANGEHAESVNLVSAAWGS